MNIFREPFFKPEDFEDLLPQDAADIANRLVETFNDMREENERLRATILEKSTSGIESLTPEKSHNDGGTE